LADFYKDEDYPVDLLEICLEQSRNNSNFDKLGKIELEAITDRILKIVRTNTLKSDLGFATISFEMEAGIYPGDHILNFKILIVGKKLKSQNSPIYKEMEELANNEVGGTISVRTKTVDKQTLQIDLIPIQLELSKFVDQRPKNLKDKYFYTDDVLKVLFQSFYILSKEDILDPIYKFNIDRNE
jgi:hypothetical protein